MEDSRLSQITALVDDARTIAAELMDDTAIGNGDRIVLALVRRELNTVIEAVNHLKES